MSGDELGEDLCEADLVVERDDGTALANGLPVGKQDGEGVEVVVVDTGDVGVGDNNVWEVAEGLETVGEADGEEREGEVGG